MINKIFFLLALVPTLSWGSSVPLGEFDQVKLENILRRIPSAYQGAERRKNFERKSYTFPNEVMGLQINCHADHYSSATIPSFTKCTINLKEMNTDDVSSSKSGDEYFLIIKNREVVKALSDAVSYRKANSLEQIDGETFDGAAGKLFRYTIDCTTNNCKLTFATKAKESL